MPKAVAAAKASVLRAEKEVVPDLLAEAYAFNGTLGNDATRHALQAFLDRGGQTVEGESRLGDLAVLWYGAVLVIRGDLTLGQLIAFRIIAGTLTASLRAPQGSAGTTMGR